MISATGLLPLAGLGWMSPAIISFLMPSWFRCSLDHPSSCCLLCMPCIRHTLHTPTAVRAAAWTALVLPLHSALQRSLPAQVPWQGGWSCAVSRGAGCHNGATQLPGSADEFLKVIQDHQKYNRVELCFFNLADTDLFIQQQAGGQQGDAPKHWYL